MSRGEPSSTNAPLRVDDCQFALGFESANLRENADLQGGGPRYASLPLGGFPVRWLVSLLQLLLLLLVFLLQLLRLLLVPLLHLLLFPFIGLLFRQHLVLLVLLLLEFVSFQLLLRD